MKDNEVRCGRCDCLFWTLEEMAPLSYFGMTPCHATVERCVERLGFERRKAREALEPKREVA